MIATVTVPRERPSLVAKMADGYLEAAVFALDSWAESESTCPHASAREPLPPSPADTSAIASWPHRAIAEQLGVPSSTVGDWLRGFGEMAEIRTCWCGAKFIARSGKAVYCSRSHTYKRWAIYGPMKGDHHG